MASLPAHSDEQKSPSFGSARNSVDSISQVSPDRQPVPRDSLNIPTRDGNSKITSGITPSVADAQNIDELKDQNTPKGNATAFERRMHIEHLQELADKARENGGTPAVSVETKLAVARSDLAKFESSTVYQRAQAFDRLPQNEALASFPELDASFKQLEITKREWTPQTTQDQRERAYFGARVQLSDQLHRGDLPKAPVSLDESRQVIQMAAAARGLMVREAQEIKQDFRGEVVVQSSHHVLLKVSDMMAIQYQKAKLDREVTPGEKLAIQHGNDQSHVRAHDGVMAQSQVLNKDASREHAMGQERGMR